MVPVLTARTPPLHDLTDASATRPPADTSVGCSPWIRKVLSVAQRWGCARCAGAPKANARPARHRPCIALHNYPPRSIPLASDRAGDEQGDPSRATATWCDDDL